MDKYLLYCNNMYVDSVEATREGLDKLFLKYGILLRDGGCKIFKNTKELKINRTITIKLIEDDEELYYLEDFY